MVAALLNDVTITVPGTPVAMSGTAADGTLSASMGSVTVAETRPGAKSWIVSVSATDLTRGGGGTIAKSNIAYWSGPVTSSTGSGSRTPGQPTAGQAVPLSTTVTAFRGSKTSMVGNTSTSWEPTLIVTIPLSAAAGTYTATITHSVA